jgi:hypothetical protein
VLLCASLREGVASVVPVIVVVALVEGDNTHHRVVPPAQLAHTNFLSICGDIFARVWLWVYLLLFKAVGFS